MLRVIIADDENKICQLLRVLVKWEELGFEIIDVEHDGKDLLRAVQELAPDVVITDIRMPGCSGLELLHEIRQQNMDIEVLIMSGYREFEYVRSALRDGAADYLLKPLNRNALQEALMKIRERKEIGVLEQEKLETMQQTIDVYSQKVRENIIPAMRSGELTTIDIARLNREYQCKFEKSALFFASFKIDLKEILPQKICEVLRSKLQNLIEDNIKRAGLSCICGKEQNFLFALINADEIKEVETCLQKLIYEAKDYISRVDEGSVTIGLAKVEREPLSLAWKQSIYAARDQVFRGSSRVLLANPDISLCNPANAVNRSSARLLQDALMRGSGEELKNTLYDRLAEIRFMNLQLECGESVYRCMSALQKQLINVCHSVCEDETVDSLLNDYSVLLGSCDRFSAYERLFEEEAMKLTATITEQRTKKEKRPIRLIRQCVEENYAQPLTLEKLAEDLGMNPAYISRLIKKEMNVNFSKYLNSVRLEHAKNLLETTTDSAAAIASAIGYNDEKYFLRVFKKEVGLTTGEYRRLYGE